MIEGDAIRPWLRKNWIFVVGGSSVQAILLKWRNVTYSSLLLEEGTVIQPGVTGKSCRVAGWLMLESGEILFHLGVDDGGGIPARKMEHWWR